MRLSNGSSHALGPGRGPRALDSGPRASGRLGPQAPAPGPGPWAPGPGPRALGPAPRALKCPPGGWGLGLSQGQNVRQGFCGTGCRGPKMADELSRPGQIYPKIRSHFGLSFHVHVFAFRSFQSRVHGTVERTFSSHLPATSQHAISTECATPSIMG